jgi:hypothetical protein
MKTTIKIVQYDNGISIEDVDDQGNTIAIVSLERTQREALGELIWEHVKSVMDFKLTNEVKLNIEITTD